MRGNLCAKQLERVLNAMEGTDNYQIQPIYKLVQEADKCYKKFDLIKKTQARDNTMYCLSKYVDRNKWKNKQNKPSGFKRVHEWSCLWAFGIAAIEIWVLNEETNLLDCARGGWWRDRVFKDSLQLRRLEDHKAENYLEVESFVLGLGSTGALYLEVQGEFGLATWCNLTQLSNDPNQPKN